MFGAIWLRTGGHVLFTLDDPYIHLALAERLAESSHYGINPGEAAAPASSILYPFLLVPFVALGIGQLGAALYCGIGIIATAVLFAAILVQAGIRVDRSGPIGLGVLLVVFELGFNLLGLASTGLEHALHVAVTLGCILGLLRFLRGAPPSALLLACAFLAPMIRYEGASLWIGTVVLLAWNGRRVEAGLLLAAGALCLGGFSLFLMSLGLPPLPSSVLAKTALVSSSATYRLMLAIAVFNCGFAGGSFCLAGLMLIGLRAPWLGRLALAIGLGCFMAAAAILLLGLPAIPPAALGHRFGIGSTLAFLAWNDLTGIVSQPGPPQLLFLAVLIAIGLVRACKKADSALIQLGCLGLMLVLAHLAAGKFGWFSRYEIYVLVAAAAIALCLHAEDCARWLAGAGAMSLGAACAVVLVVMEPYAHHAWDFLDSAENITDQQYQLHRFATEFRPGGAAVSDLGEVSYHNPYYVLDLWGLGSAAALQARAAGANPIWMARLARAHEVRSIMIFEQDFPALPSGWVKMGRLVLHRPFVTVEHLDVAFFAPSAAEAGEMHRDLVAFAAALPAADRFEFATP